MDAKVITAETARQDWGHVMDAVNEGQDVVVERDTKPAVAVIPYEDYQAILEELAELRAVRRATARRAALRSGVEAAVPWSEVKAQLRADGLLDD